MEVFAAALERAPGQRASYLRSACGDDAELLARVSDLLGALDRAGSFLEKPAERPADSSSQLPTSPGAAAVHTPLQIGPYRLNPDRVLGAGGMGTVHEAVQEHPRRTVALKVMRRGLGSRSSAKRFEREADLLGRLRHPGIAQVYDAGVFQDPAALPGTPALPYLVMEYIPGAQSLTEFAASRRLTVPQRLELFLKVCDAVHYGHGRGIVHRDLKPSNILIDSTGDLPQPKVIDFGVARATDADLASTSLATEANQLIGTLQYMSPEQAGAGDAREIDARSDVYSLGVVLYELLTGELPYNLAGCSISEATRRIREEFPPRSAMLLPGTREDLAVILEGALQKDRARRYQSAADLRDDLQRYLRDEPIRRRGDSATYLLTMRARRWANAHRWSVRMLIVALAVAVIQTIGMRAVFVWTPLNGWIERGMAAAMTGGGDPLSHIVLSPIQDAPDAESAARSLGASTDQASHPKYLRRLHGALMQRIASAFPPGSAEMRPRAVVWDLMFIGDSPFDAEFVSGVEALRASGVPVVAAAPCWDLDERAVEVLSPDIRDAVRLGTPTGHFGDVEPWKLNLAMRRSPVDTVPSLALAAFSASSAPTATAWYAVDEHAYSIRIWYTKPSSAGSQFRRALSAVNTVDFSAQLVEFQADPDLCVRPGDLSTLLTLDLPSDERIAAATVPYASLLTMPLDALRARVADRFVFVYDDRTGTPDGSIPTPDGRALHGCVGQATGLGMLLASRVPRMPRFWEELLALVLGGFAGLAVTSGAPAGRILARRAAIAGAAIVGACLLAQHFLLIRCNPLMPLLAASLAGAIVFAPVVALRSRAPKEVSA